MLECHAAMFTEAFANLTEAKHLATLYEIQGHEPPEPGIRLFAKQANFRLRQALIFADMQEFIPSLDRLDSAIDGRALGQVARFPLRPVP